MEVREESIDYLELVAGVDEAARPAAAGLHLPALGTRFQRPDAGRAHGDDPPARGSGAVDGLSRLGRDLVVLPVHDMVFDVVGDDGLEGAPADVEGDPGQPDAFRLQPVEAGPSEVQAGRGGRDGTLALGVDGLVPVTIRCPGLRALDVRGEGSRAELVEESVPVALELEAGRPQATL